ncbi:unnamed protein product [marine sediment metagenome]|uniref:DUF192 domain-containing protein n=1 Tax=marine sediment metagenome TaxID=412755 RepID=X0ZEM8_9ZZZZ
MKLIEILNEMTNHPFPNKKQLTIKNSDGNDVGVECEYAKTPEEKMTGVLGMSSMCENCGILFDEISPTYYHMQGVKFPLDMVFCDDKGTILDIITAQPDGDNVYPPSGSHFNIEVNGGFCDNNNINKGDVVYIS